MRSDEKHAKERKRKSAKERKRAQESAKERKRVKIANNPKNPAVLEILRRSKFIYCRTVIYYGALPRR